MVDKAVPAVSLLLFTGAARAQAAHAVAVLLPELVLAALVAGVVTGAWGFWRPDGPAPRWHTGFLVYLGLITVMATTLSGSMEIAPLALLVAAVSGILPFLAGFGALRWLLRRWRGR
jgi:hypothetical protein